MNKAVNNKAIIARGIGKEYCLGGAEQYHESFRELLRNMFLSPFRKFGVLSGRVENDPFWALKDINFEIPVGQVTGIIGRNGAGKSTLLKVLSRITTPTVGRVEIRGRVASLLEVGSGFHPELTGRENIYMNASILGMRRQEVHRKLDDIVQFAEIERFLDTPVKRYSSGMYVRLAFSVAAHVEPDVLLVDEVLAVGDAKFQQRCIGKLNEVGQQGRTVLFVSHNIGLIQKLCSHTIYLKDGQVEQCGATHQVIPFYLLEGAGQKGEWVSEDSSSTVKRVRLLDNNGNGVSSAGYLSELNVEICFTPFRKDEDYILSLEIADELGRSIFTSWDTDSTLRETLPSKTYNAICELPVGLLRPGSYFITVMVRNLKHRFLENIEESSIQFEVTGVDFNMNAERIGTVLPILAWHVNHNETT